MKQYLHPQTLFIRLYPSFQTWPIPIDPLAHLPYKENMFHVKNLKYECIPLAKSSWALDASPQVARLSISSSSICKQDPSISLSWGPSYSPKLMLGIFSETEVASKQMCV